MAGSYEEGPDIQVLGERILTLVSGVLKAMKLYEVNNDTVQKLIAEIADSTNAWSEVTGGTLMLLAEGDNVFLNEEFLRLERHAFEKVAQLERIFRRLRVNEIAFYPGCTTESLTLFFQRISGTTGSASELSALGQPDETFATLRSVEGIARKGRSEEDRRILALRLESTLALLARDFLYRSLRQAFPPTVRLRRVLQRMIDLQEEHSDYLLGVGHMGGAGDGLPGHLARSALLAAHLARAIGVEKRRVERAALGVFVGHVPMARLEERWSEAPPQEIDTLYRAYLDGLLKGAGLSGVSAWRMTMLQEARASCSGQRPWEAGLSTSFDGRVMGVATWYDRMRAGLLPGRAPLSPPTAVAFLQAVSAGKIAGPAAACDSSLAFSMASALGLMPPGTVVRVPDGGYAVLRERPMAVRIADGAGALLPEPELMEPRAVVAVDAPALSVSRVFGVGLELEEAR